MSGDLMELQVEEIHGRFREGSLSCTELVQSYLDRIAAYDKQGPSINAIINVNAAALEQARAFDVAYCSDRALKPLDGIPVILKDNYDTADMPTTGGSIALTNARPRRDAFVVERLRSAGAIILAKANLMELARGGTTVSSLGGQTRNPYDLNRTPGGSSGGTGAAIAANFGVLGTGSDTGQSTRSPASAASLVGIRGTRGLLSRRGIIPLSTTQDEPGPIARSVTDAARMLEAMAAFDPEDPITAFGEGLRSACYTANLKPTGLAGHRIGLLVDYLGTEEVHAPVNAIVKAAVSTFEDLGATVVPVLMPGIDELTADVALTSFEFRAAFKQYLEGVEGVEDIVDLPSFIRSGRFLPTLAEGFKKDCATGERLDSPEYREKVLRRQEIRQLVMTTLATNGLSALLYPHQRRLVAKIGEPQIERNGVLSNSTGFPALTFPGGFSPATDCAPLGVPVGLEVLGPAWSEPTLLKIAYEFEQATAVRKPPVQLPPL